MVEAAPPGTNHPQVVGGASVPSPCGTIDPQKCRVNQLQMIALPFKLNHTGFRIPLWPLKLSWTWPAGNKVSGICYIVDRRDYPGIVDRRD